MTKERNSKHAFWQALVFTIIIFGVGLILGFYLESSRADKVQNILRDSEINILDDELRNRIVKNFDVKCDLALESTFKFADKIFLEAAKLEEYDGAAKFTELLVLHRRYDLLRTLLWSQAVELKRDCANNNDFHTIVYLYQYDVQNVDIDSRQLYYSRLLFDLKLKYPKEIILIPIAGNTDLSSVELILDNYNIDELPIIMIDEEKVVDDIITLEEIEKMIFKDGSNINLGSGL